VSGAGPDRPEDLPEDQAEEQPGDHAAADDPDEDRAAGSPEDSGQVGEPSEGADDFEAAFRSIVENYGERPAIAAPDPVDTQPPAAPPPGEGPVVSPGLFRLAGEQEAQPPPDHEDHFVPPDPPPLPWPEPNRGLAWLALFGSPTLMLGALLLSVSLPSWITTLLGFTFIGGFVYLVATMRRGPSDGWDDGARL
jgi:hypothetical protein